MNVTNGLKSWSVLLLIIFLTSCSNDVKDFTPEQAAHEVIELLRTGDYQTVHDQWFGEELQASIPMDQLEREWEKRSADGGEFVDVHSLNVEKRANNLEVIEGKVEYTNLTLDFRMIFNNQLLVGFSLPNSITNASLPDSIVEEEIIVGEGTAYELGGTLTLPKNQDNLPAVVLVHGSGPSDRDESVYAYKPFRDIAWGLAEQGIAVIRYDKRTYTYGEKAVKDTNKITVYEETIEDAIRATELLKSDKRIDENNVYILGHSLGGMLAPRIDLQGGDYAGIIILAGSPRPLWEIVYDQNKAVLENTPMNESDKNEQKELVEEEYKKAQQLREISEDEAKKMTVFGMNGYYLKEMDQYNVASIVSKLDKPLFILQGEDDFQVSYEKDFTAWQELLEDSENATISSYPDLNHFFVDYQGPGEGTIKEYETPKQVDKKVINDIGEWMFTQLKENN
ncbi:alpha/beta fold hydrolase [Gracilibacillus thailandensis]|uniref:Alpha/beta fold hydrolase n=1 Tax=Gracilibacillus thailandensis TaxID=563735 RepID=A0A6N7R289_9BACI|nr:alpha/beta fold hydrolase [Gracilibacillus thailandensis]MRI67531.1 alpha/beta fold hydrolase [Gracilibacillus thailandensis]